MIHPPAARRGVLMAGALAVFLSGCGAFSRPTSNPFQGSGERRISVIVENRSGSTVVVEAMGPDRQVSLGAIEQGARVSFVIPWPDVAPLRFSIYRTGLQPHTTVPLTLAPGERAELWVQDPIEMSVVHR
jgi:hypothetical protein